MKNIVLFDMDGTLTEPRQKMGIQMEQQLLKLQESGHEIGIITESDMNYVKQQCSGLFDLSLVDTSRIHFLPCNGTKYILDRETVYERNMREYMGDRLWSRLMILLIDLQRDLVLQHKIPLTGHFFDYRGSIINWCPIGRNASLEDRKKWEDLDVDNKIRKPFLKQLKALIYEHVSHLGDLAEADIELKVKYGGDTSFDIFPVGWDKTYILEKTNIFSEYETIHFIGDRCGQNGNDYELYMHPRTIGIETTSPQKTIKIVNKIINSIV